MTRYLISFDAYAMDYIPDEEGPAVAKAAHAVVQQAINAGVYESAGGLENRPASIMATRRDRRRRPLLGRHRWIHARRGVLARGGAGMGCQDRRRLPRPSRSPGDRARPRTR